MGCCNSRDKYRNALIELRQLDKSEKVPKQLEEKLEEAILANPDLVWERTINNGYDMSILFFQCNIAGLAARAGSVKLLKIIKRAICTVAKSPEELKDLLIRVFESSYVTFLTTISSIDIAIEYGQLECLKYLVEECCPNADRMLRAIDTEETTPFMSAVIGNHIEIVKYIIEKTRSWELVGKTGDSFRMRRDFAITFNKDGPPTELEIYLRNINQEFLRFEEELLLDTAANLSPNSLLPVMLGKVIGEQTKTLRFCRKLPK